MLGHSVRKDDTIMPRVGNDYASIDLDYDQNNSSRCRGKPPVGPDHAGSIPGVMREAVRALGKLEAKMLQQAGA